jgi:hypothetical protein
VARIQHQVFAPSRANGRTDGKAGRVFREYAGSSTLGTGADVANVLGLLPVAGCDRERCTPFSTSHVSRRRICPAPAQVIDRMTSAKDALRRSRCRARPRRDGASSHP